MVNGKQDNQSPRRLLGGVWTALSILLGILSISSLIQRWGDITMAELTGEVLAYYRVFMDQAKWLFFDWWPPIFGWGIWMPQWGMDLTLIWGLAITGNMRVIAAHDSLIGRWKEIRIENSRDRMMQARALDGLVLRTRYLFFQQIVLAPIEFAFRPLRRSVRVVSKLMRAPWWGSGADLTAKMALATIRMEAALIFVQLVPLVGGVLFFFWNAVQISG